MVMRIFLIEREEIQNDYPAKRKNNASKYGLLCGRIATGAIKITEKTSLQLCDACRQLLDPDDKMERMPFNNTSNNSGYNNIFKDNIINKKYCFYNMD